MGGESVMRGARIVSACAPLPGLALVYSDGRHEPVICLVVDSSGDVCPVSASLESGPLEEREGYMRKCPAGRLHTHYGDETGCPVCESERTGKPVARLIDDVFERYL
jgi:hypothetical protein